MNSATYQARPHGHSRRIHQLTLETNFGGPFSGRPTSSEFRAFPMAVLVSSSNGWARLRELYKNLAISQRELDQAASDQQTAKAICVRRCQQEAPTREPVGISVNLVQRIWRAR
jgi:hypothetical protein